MSDPAVCFEHKNASGSVLKAAVYWDTFADAEFSEEFDLPDAIRDILRSIGHGSRSEGMIVPPAFFRVWVEGDGACDENIENIADTMFQEIKQQVIR